MDFDLNAIGELLASLGIKSVGDLAVLILVCIAIPKTRKWLGFGNGNYATKEALAAHEEKDNALANKVDELIGEFKEFRGEVRGLLKGKESQ